MSQYMRNLSTKLRKPKRITISIEEGIDQKISQLQTHLRDIACEEWSTSKTINMILLCGILSHNSLNLRDLGKVKEFTDGSKIGLEDINMESYVSNLAALKQAY